MSHRSAGQACDCGARGWMPGVEHIPIQWALPDWIRQREGKMAPVAVVDHIMQGYQSTIINWARNGESKIITHFSIGRDGRIAQHLSVFTPGIHVSAVINPAARVVLARGAPVRGANTYTIGKEHEGCSEPPRGYTVPESIVWTRSNPWPEPMVRSSIEVNRWCFANVPSLGEPNRDSVIGHYEVDARNRPNDPATTQTRDVWPVARMLAAMGSQEPAGTHTIVRGETLGRIALRYGVATADLARWNSLDDPNRIEVGQVLRLSPASAAVADASASAETTDGAGASEPVSSIPDDQLTANQRELLEWLRTPAGSRLPALERRRLLREAGLPADQDRSSEAPADHQGAEVPPPVSPDDRDAWEEFRKNGAQPLDVQKRGPDREARYVVRRVLGRGG